MNVWLLLFVLIPSIGLAQDSKSTDEVVIRLDRRMDDLEKSVNNRFDASVKAVDAASASQKSAVDAAFAAQRSAVEAAFAAQKSAVDSALASADRAVTKAEAASEKRFESVNEFRQTLSDQTSSFITRVEMDAKHVAFDVKNQALSDKLDNIITRIDRIDGRTAGATSFANAVVIGISLLITIGSVLYAIFRAGKEIPVLPARRATDPPPT